MAEFSAIRDSSTSGWQWKVAVVEPGSGVAVSVYATTDSETRANRIATLLNADEGGS